MEALAHGDMLPYKRAQRETSSLQRPGTGAMAGPQTMPRSHA